MANKLKIGRVRPVYLGIFNENRAYRALERVKYNSVIYECLKDAPAGTIPPDNDDYWLSLIASAPAPVPRWDGTKLYFEYGDGERTEAVEMAGQNRDVLDGLSDDGNGQLLYKGQPLGGTAIVAEDDVQAMPDGIYLITQ